MNQAVGDEMGCPDAPFLGVEVIGTGTEVLCKSEALATIADLHDASRCVGRQYENFALEVAESIGEGEVDARGISAVELVGRQGRQARTDPVGQRHRRRITMSLAFSLLLLAMLIRRRNCDGTVVFMRYCLFPEDGEEEAFTSYEAGQEVAKVRG